MNHESSIPAGAEQPWKRTSPTFLGGALLAAFMFLLAVRGFADPVAAAKGFGLPLLDHGDAVFLWIKAGRDLGIGLMLTALLAVRQRAAFGFVVLAASVMPLTDFLVTSTSDRGSVVYALMVHGSAVLYVLVLGAALLRPSRPGADGRARGPRLLGVLGPESKPRST
jgi:hypothetical protein